MGSMGFQGVWKEALKTNRNLRKSKPRKRKTWPHTTTILVRRCGIQSHATGQVGQARQARQATSHLGFGLSVPIYPWLKMKPIAPDDAHTTVPVAAHQRVYRALEAAHAPLVRLGARRYVARAMGGVIGCRGNAVPFYLLSR